MTKTIDEIRIQENLLKLWKEGSLYQLRTTLDTLINKTYLRPEESITLLQYQDLFTWTETAYLKSHYSVQIPDYTETIKCASYDEAVAYKHGQKEYKFPDESCIDWFEHGQEHGSPSLTGDCHQEILLRVSGLDLKNPPKQKTHKVVFLVTTENGSTDDDILSEVESVLNESELLGSRNSCLEVTEHEDYPSI